jgi:fructose-1,6-bisphosphatase/inositol monophosphatase family enzyme
MNLNPTELFSLGQKYTQIVVTSQGKSAYKTKDSENDFVTETDTFIEELFREWLKKNHPDHKIIGEEGPKDTLSPSDIIWYIDPIDGTANFIEGDPNVTMHFGCIHNGSPLFSMVIKPFFNQIYIAHNNHVSLNKNPLAPSLANHPFIIGTEYLDHRKTEDKNFHALLKETNAQGLRVRSIGINLLHLLEGKSHVFYKPATKLWDVIAPLILIHTHRPDIALELHTPQGTQESPFSNDPNFLTYLNEKHQKDCRAGLILAYPKNNPDIKEKILKKIKETL